MNLDLAIEMLLLLVNLVRIGASLQAGDPDETEVDPEF